MFKQLLLHRNFPFQEFPIIVLVIIPAESKTMTGFTDILFFALVTCQQMNKTFVIAIKLMIGFILNIGDRTFKAVCFIEIQAHLTAFTTTFKRARKSV